MGRDEIATVKSWDARQGRGVLQRHGGADFDVTREQLLDEADLHEGQRVAFRETYEECAPRNWGWVIHDLRGVSDDEAAALDSVRFTHHPLDAS